MPRNNDLTKFVKELEKKVEQARGDVSFPELFDPNFMTTYTNYSSIDEFFKMSPFDIKNQEDFEELDEIEFNKFVSGNTRFNSWEEMKAKAGELYMKKKLGFN